MELAASESLPALPGLGEKDASLETDSRGAAVYLLPFVLLCQVELVAFEGLSALLGLDEEHASFETNSRGAAIYLLHFSLLCLQCQTNFPRASL